MIEVSVNQVYLGNANAVPSMSSRMVHSDSTTMPYERGKDKDQLSFLDLPYEIRLRIYQLIHVSSPVQRQQLAPWHCIQNCRTYIVQAMSTMGDGNVSEPLKMQHGGAPEQPHTDGLLSSDRPLCRIPTALIQSCRQIHAEARVVPFHENEFVFINWFSPGLSSALAFMQDREQWQRAEMRFMRLEVFAQNLVTSSAKFLDWVQLCEHLPCLRGLRLVLCMDGNAAYQSLGRTGVSMLTRAGATVLADEKEMQDPRELVCERTEWIVKGLARLRELRQLEVDLVDVKWTAREQIEWCARLQKVLQPWQTYTKGKGAKVVCVERVMGGK